MSWPLTGGLRSVAAPVFQRRYAGQRPPTGNDYGSIYNALTLMLFGNSDAIPQGVGWSCRFLSAPTPKFYLPRAASKLVGQTAPIIPIRAKSVFPKTSGRKYNSRLTPPPQTATMQHQGGSAKLTSNCIIRTPIKCSVRRSI